MEKDRFDDEINSMWNQIDAEHPESASDGSEICGQESLEDIVIETGAHAGER